jgi:autotransporter-associated beta strand protein
MTSPSTRACRWSFRLRQAKRLTGKGLTRIQSTISMASNLRITPEYCSTVTSSTSNSGILISGNIVTNGNKLMFEGGGDSTGGKKKMLTITGEIVSTNGLEMRSSRMSLSGNAELVLSLPNAQPNLSGEIVFDGSSYFREDSNGQPTRIEVGHANSLGTTDLRTTGYRLAEYYNGENDLDDPSKNYAPRFEIRQMQSNTPLVVKGTLRQETVSELRLNGQGANADIVVQGGISGTSAYLRRGNIIFDTQATTGKQIVELSGTGTLGSTLVFGNDVSAGAAMELRLANASGTQRIVEPLAMRQANTLLKVVKSGSGITAFDADQVHTGGTVVESGTLLVNGGNGAAASAGQITAEFFNFSRTLRTPSTAGLAVGQSVSGTGTIAGTGIVSGSIITSIIDATHFEVSQFPNGSSGYFEGWSYSSSEAKPVTLGAYKSSGLGSGLVEVKFGATLGGNGTIAMNNDVVLRAGSRLSPGTSAGTLTFDLGTGSLVLEEGAKMFFELGSVSDKIVMKSGSIDVAGGLDMSDFILSGTPAAGLYTLIQLQGDAVITDGFTPWSGIIDGNSATADMVGGSLVLTVVVPEPACLALPALACVLASRRIRWILASGKRA